jgi:hypothetical protein
VRFDHRFAHPYEPITESFRTHALCRYTPAFEQQKQLIRQHFRLRELGGSAQLDEGARCAVFEGAAPSPRSGALA